MPWNGSGVFNRVYSWVADAAAGIDILATRMDTDTDDITSNGFGNCLTRDGQGAPTSNLPMSGFRHTDVANAVDPTDYLTLGQVQTSTVPGVPTVGALLGEIRQIGIVESLLPTLAPGWHVCDGSTRPRTDPVWVQAGDGNWAWGNGNGTTTYTLPDLRGRAVFGKDNMGGVAANRLTNAVSGVTGATLGSTGGNEHAQADTIGINVAGSITLTGTVGVTIPDHNHSYTVNQSGNLISAGGAANFGAQTTANTGDATLTPSVSNTLAISNTQTITGTSSLTGSSQNVPPAAVINFIIYVGAV